MNRGSRAIPFLFIVFLVMMFVTGGYTASNEEYYELQEKCCKRADEVFKHEYGNGQSSDEHFVVMSSYKSQYNRKFRRCFILITTAYTAKDNRKTGSIMKDLWDITKHKAYGVFIGYDKSSTPNQCEVLGKYCKSQSEWDSLTSQFINE